MVAGNWLVQQWPFTGTIPVPQRYMPVLLIHKIPYLPVLARSFSIAGIERLSSGKYVLGGCWLAYAGQLHDVGWPDGGTIQPL